MLISRRYLEECRLTPREIKVLLLHYDEDGMALRTLEEMSRYLNGISSKQGVHRIEKEAVSKLPKIVQKQLVGDLKPPTLDDFMMIRTRFSGQGHSYEEVAEHFPLKGAAVAARVKAGIRRIVARENAGVLTKKEKAVIRRAKRLTKASSIIQANKALKPLLQSRAKKKHWKRLGPTDVEKFAKAARVSPGWVYWAIDKLVERGVPSPEMRQVGFGQARIVLSDKMVEALWQFREEKRGKVDAAAKNVEL